MALLLHFLFLAILGACCAEDAGRSRRAASDWPAGIFPNSLYVSTDVSKYSETLGNYSFNDAMYNGYPVYNGGVDNNEWFLYRRDSGIWYLVYKQISENTVGTEFSSRDNTLPPWLAKNWQSNFVVSINYFDLETAVVAGGNLATGKHVHASWSYKNGYPQWYMSSNGVYQVLIRSSNGPWTVQQYSPNYASFTVGSGGELLPIGLTSS